MAVTRQQLTEKQERECRVFGAFLKIAPAFAGEELADWAPPAEENDFPDIRANSVAGQRIGVELGEWLHQKEIAAAKTKEFIEDSILGVIGEQGPNHTAHIHHLWLHPKAKAPITPVDVEAFRFELFALIDECDRRWPEERFWRRGTTLANDDLAAYPTLSKYLAAIRLWPREYHEPWGEGIPWITFPMRAGAFSQETMLKPLRDLVSAKINHYNVSGYDHLSLLIYYDQAALFNSPVETPLHSFDDAAKHLTDYVDGDLGPFQSIYLFIWLDGGRVIKIA
jgi:hypothetical protein